MGIKAKLLWVGIKCIVQVDFKDNFFLFFLLNVYIKTERNIIHTRNLEII